MSQQIEVVRRMVDAFSTGEVGDVHEYIHPGYRNPATLEHFPDLTGPESFAMVVKWVQRTFSEESFLEEVGYEEKGSWVRARLVLYGRHVGPLVGIPPTGRRFSGEQIHLARIVDGRIRDHRDWPDFQGTLRQLGDPWPAEEGWRA